LSFPVSIELSCSLFIRRTTRSCWSPCE
jgi:hypothetical protein